MKLSMNSDKKNQKRKSYDTKIKYLAREGLLPEKYAKDISKSLISKWKSEPDDKYIGFELNDQLEELFEISKLNQELIELKKYVKSLYKINLILKDLLKKDSPNKSPPKENKEQVVRTINFISNVEGKKKACKILDISYPTYLNWSRQVKHKCINSLLKICTNNYPQQLTISEVKKMESLLEDRRYKLWPITSIAHFGFKNNIIYAHVNTWYKYSKLLAINRKKLKKYKRKYDYGIRAQRPNEKWHADITQLKMSDGQIAYIYLVIDNYSRFILSWQVASNICAKTRLQTFKDSLNYVKKNSSSTVKLFVDGGSENNNKLIDSYISEEDIPLQKYITMKDILKSNAMIERVNNVLKYEYLFSIPINNLGQLVIKMSETVENYNFIRPQGVLNGLTPAEAFAGNKVDLLQRNVKIKTTAKDRFETNRKDCCSTCSYICNNP